MRSALRWPILISFCFGIFYTLVVRAQGLPNTSVFLFDLNLSDDNALANAQYLSEFNPEGYNNQPSFFDENSLYLTSDWRAKGQTDIVKLNLLRNAILKITDTEESDYSPTLMPDGKNFSTIVAIPSDNGSSPQLLWQYPLDRSNGGKAISFAYDNVGYHCWLSRDLVALFLVGDPHSLVLLNTKDQSVVEIDKNIGRCLKMNKKGELIYVYKAGLNIWYLRSYNPLTKEKNIIAETRSGSEDFDINTDGSIIMGQGSRLFLLSIDSGWRQIDDLNRFGINKISRIAVYGNKIAIVNASN